MIEWHLCGTSRRLADVPKGACVDRINDREVIATCEGCGGPIIDGQAYGFDADGIYWHDKCPARRARRGEGGSRG